jgi:uncharacterized membrane protein YccC
MFGLQKRAMSPSETTPPIPTPFRPWTKLWRFAEQESLQPDLGRAIRGTVAFMVPLLLAVGGWLPPGGVSFAAIAAQNIAMVDVRGAYRMRLGLLFAMTAVFAGAAALGTLAATPLLVAVLATVFITLCGGLWRHLSSDYGPSLAIVSTLVFFLALNTPPEPGAIGRHALAAFLGGLWGLALQVANWPFRPQQPLRRTVAETWQAVANLFEAMGPAEEDARDQRQHRIDEKEAALRTTLDKTYAVLAAGRPGLLRTRLEALNLEGARLATRVAALNTALETLLSSSESADIAPALEPALKSLTNTSRTLALAVMSRQAAHLATGEVRLRRLTNLLRVLRARLAASNHDAAASGQLAEILRQIEERFPAILEALRATIDRAEERAAFSLELFDLDTWTLRPLAATLNLSRRVDPALIRFTLRLAVLMIIGVVIFKTHNLPHGYWLPFTVVVVLQPDYGSTRQRAAQRVAGTFTGSVIASLLLWLHPPFAIVATAMAATIFTFGYFLKRNYGIAVFFITLFIVLLTEATGPVTLEFTLERLLSTLAGGALALLAALFFWPMWERDRFPPVLAAGLRANRDFFRLLVARLRSGDAYDTEAIAAKRRVEAANSAIFSSLQRMTGDPKNQRDRLEYFATLANGNQRLTRVLTVLALHLERGFAFPQSELGQLEQISDESLAGLAEATESGQENGERLRELSAALERWRLPSTRTALPSAEAHRAKWVADQLTRAATELNAMLLVRREEPMRTTPA